MQIDLSSPLLSLAVIAPAAIWGATYGYRAGLKNEPLFSTCLWAWLKAAIAVAIVMVCAAALFAILGLATRTNNALLGSFLILLFGLGLAAFYLPITAVSALLGHIVGMQRKTCEHLERIQDVLEGSETHEPVLPGSEA